MSEIPGLVRHLIKLLGETTQPSDDADRILREINEQLRRRAEHGKA